MKKTITKAGIAAAAMAALGVYQYGNGTNVQILGQSMSPIIPLALSGGLGAVSADLLHESIFRLIPQNKKFENIESLLVGGGVSGALSLVSLSALYNGIDMKNALPVIAMGAASFAVADYSVEKLLSNGAKQGLLF